MQKKWSLFNAGKIRYCGWLFDIWKNFRDSKLGSKIKNPNSLLFTSPRAHMAITAIKFKNWRVK